MRNYLITIFILFVGNTVTMANTMLFNCDEPRAKVDLDVNNVRAILLNGGDMFWDIFDTRNAGYEIPKGSGKHSSFASAISMSGLDAGGNLLTAAQTYRQRGNDFWPGPLNSQGQTNKAICKEWDKMFLVYGTEIRDVIDKRNISYNIFKWPSIYAPFYDKNADGIYDPSLGDYPILDINNPRLVPGQMVFWMFNDAGNRHTSYLNNTPMQVEVHATAYAFTSNEYNALNNTTFYKYKIINKSPFAYFDYRVGMFMDHDLGNPADDYSGCDVSRELFYTYNNGSFDQIYGINPPAFGIQVLNSDKNDNGEKLGMGSFLVHNIKPDPGIPNDDRSPIILHRIMRGLWDDGSIVAYGTPKGIGNSNPCKFMFPENTDPEGRPYWVETLSLSVISDRKITVSTNSKTLLPGAITYFEHAMVWAQDTQTSKLQSVEKLKLTADTILNAYKSNFNLITTGMKNIYSKLNIYPNQVLNTFILII